MRVAGSSGKCQGNFTTGVGAGVGAIHGLATLSNGELPGDGKRTVTL